MRPLRSLFLWAAAALCLAACGTASDDAVIPHPASVEELPGSFRIHAPMALSVEAPVEAAEALTGYLKTTPLPIDTAEPDAAKNYLRLELSDDERIPASEEGYVLSVRPAGITIAARGEAGLFYGLQTLLQLHEQFGSRIPAQRIVDAPRFAYRGLHLDVSRNFFDKEFVKKQLRMMASLKLNRLHWHLTDGAGWRIQIDRYPLLTEVAAWRRGATWQQWRDGGAKYCRFDDPEASGGYYTKEEIREVVAYADSLHITVIPEIEMPGHSEEVLAVYPGLSCKGEPYSGGDFCIGNDATFEFLENVLTEVMELFPSEYIHIGGDECPKTRWEKCPACQARIKALGLKDDDRHSAEHYLQSYVTARIEKFLNEHGRRIIGWDEILEGELAPNATVMSWRGTEGGIYAAKMGHDAIMTPTTYCYLDYCQASDPENEPLNIGGYVPIEKLYSYEPVPDSLATDYAKHIIGVQANLWTEYIPTNEQLEYMLLPRVAALSEVQWCDRGTREWTRFAQALPHMLQIYDRMGLNYATTVFGVTGLTEKNAETGVEEIVLSTIDQTPIHYTLDGSEPTAESPVYTAPIALDKEYSVKAAVFREEIPTRVFSKTFTPTEQEKK